MTPTARTNPQAPNDAAHMDVKNEAVATADAHLNDVGLPTYTEVMAALKTLVDSTHETWRLNAIAGNATVAQYVRRV